MTKKMWTVVVVLVAMMAMVLACDSVEDLIDADEGAPCGRYCIKCETCQGTGEGYIQDLLDYTCIIDEAGRACQELCEQGSGLIPGVNIEENVVAAEEAAEMQITDEAYTCEEFGLTVATGQTEDSVCLRFCAKCVECVQVAGQASAAEWCAKEGGIPCVTACEQGFEDYVQSFEDIAKENTEGIETVSDIDCNDWEATADATGLDAPSF